MITVSRQDLIKALHLYQDSLNKKFLYLPLTPAVHERMKQELEQVRYHYKRGERNPVWDVKVQIVLSGPGSFELQPVLEDVTLVDRPSPAKRYQ